MELTPLTRLVRLAETGSKILCKTITKTEMEKLLIDPRSISLITPPLKAVGAIYTFKAVILEYPCTCKDLGLEEDFEVCKRGAISLCEQLRETLNEPDVDSFNNKVSQLLKGVREDIAKDLHHELIHAYIMKETNALLLGEKFGWRIRLDNMYFMEKFYSKVGRKLASEVGKHGYKVHPEFRNITGFRGLDEDRADKTLQSIQPYLKALVYNQNSVKILHDSFVHNVYLRYVISPAVAPTVEIVTWYVMDQDIRKTLRRYVKEGVFSKDLHEPIAEKLVEEIENRKPDKKSIVRAANIALDFTQEEYEDILKRIENPPRPAVVTNTSDTRNNPGIGAGTIADVANHLGNLVLDRFVRVLNGKQVNRMPRYVKTLGRVITYAIPSNIAPDFLATFTRILVKEGLLNPIYISKIADATKHYIGVHTAIYMDLVYGGRLEPIGCNPISPFFGHYIKRTGSVLTTTELLVGDTVLALRGFLTLGHIIGAHKIKCDKSSLEMVFGKGEQFSRIRKLLLEKPSVCHEIVAKGDSFQELFKSPNPEHAYNVIETFVYAVLVLGERIKILEGPHGLWYL